MNGASWRVDHVELHLDLAADEVRVTCTSSVRRTGAGAPGPLVLDGRGLTTHEVAVDATPVALGADVLGERTLTLHLPGDAHEVRTVVSVRPGAIGDKGVTSGALISTNCEPEGFRRITWALDRPDNRATYDVTLVGDRSAYPVLLANGDLVDAADLGEGRHLARYVDPVPKPSYLFAVVAGDLETVSSSHTRRSGRPLELRVTAPRGMTAGAAFALRTMAEVIAFDEAQGGIEHDLDALTFVAIPGYPDATEYHGLMFFDASLLVVDPAGWTDDDLLLIMANIAHEYGHHVRGNRVTVRSWGQLAMKEGLTVLTAQNDFRRHVFGPVARVLDVADLRRLQYPEEVTIGAPVLRGEVGNPEQLYTRTTYLKGAEVFGMLRTLVGATAWRAAFDEFVSRHDLGVAGVDDVVAALRDACPDAADDVDAVARWFGLAGRPALSIRTGSAAASDGGAAGVVGAIEIRIDRTDALADDPPVAIPVRLGFRRPDGLPAGVDIDGVRADRHTVVLHERTRTLHVETQGPVVVAPLLGASAPVDLATDHGADHLAVLVAAEDDPFARWWAAQELMIRAVDAARAGDGAAVASHVELLAGALRRTIAADTPPMLLAQLLAVPDEFVLGDRTTPIDVDGVAAGLDALRTRLGAALHDDLLDVLDRWSDDAVGGTDAGDVARRSLVEPCLALLLATGTPAAIATAEAQLAHPDHTRAVRALAQLLHLHTVPSDRVDGWVADTHDRWSAAPKLLDRWLRAQSGGRRRDTIARVRSLRDGPLYDRHQRGRVMGLWFPFATRNRSVFHDPSGEGYRLFVDEVIELMPINAGVVIRLVGDLLQYQRFDDHRRALLRDELERMATAPGMPDFAVAIVRGLLSS